MDNQRILKEGDLVQWYRIEKILGHGGFGVTYLATDTNLDHKVAIKEYMPGWAVQRQPDNSLTALNDTLQDDFDLGVSNFLREARTLVKFRHPNIVRVMAVFEANNTAYLVMEYEEGEEFKSFVQNDDSIDEQSLKSLILRIVDGLDQVHQYGFLHRDIKPVNLIIRNDGSPVLLDFGAARPTDADAGAHTAYVSAGYTPIEQYQEGDGMEVGPWTDIYSLGATVYYAISGRTPVGPTGRLAALVQKSPDPLEPARVVGAGRYSDRFLEVIDWALNFRPGDRPQNLSEWRDAIDFNPEPIAVQQFQPEQQPRYNDTQRLRQREKPVSKAPLAPYLLAAAGALVLAVAGSFLYRSYEQQSALSALIAEADNHFDRGDYADGAPLYREVLASDPANPNATSRLQEIEAIYSEQFNSALASGKFDQADTSLTSLGSITSNRNTVSAARERLRAARELRSVESQFDRVQSLNASGEYDEAITVLATLRTQGSQDPRVEQLQNAAELGIEEREARQQRQAEELAAERRREADNKSRIAEANRRQRERRQSYENHLRNAEEALSAGDIDAARGWLDDASRLQINDQRLANLESRVVTQENYQRKPLSEYEVSYATGQFSALGLAVESKNQLTINSLTDGSPSRQSLFNSLFDRYTRLDVEVLEIKPALNPKRVTATLRIVAMILPNGDIVYPSPAYRDSELRLNRERYGWSRIIW